MYKGRNGWLFLVFSISSSRSASYPISLPGAQSHCRTLATMSSPHSTRSSTPTLHVFLTEASHQRKLLLSEKEAPSAATSSKPIINAVMGNQAADADSIISSICLSYLLHHQDHKESSNGHPSTTPKVYVPILPISRAEMSLRPETLLLFNRVHVNARDLVHIDEVAVLPALAAQETRVQFSLVDHNRLAESFQYLEKCVIRIVDHHEDQGFYSSVQGEDREVAFGPGPTDTVASCCTLVAERYLSQAPELLDITISTLLLGVIMIDSAGLDPNAGKVTPRDQRVVEALEAKIAAPSSSSEDHQNQCRLLSKESLYRALSDAKFDRDSSNTHTSPHSLVRWWLSLSIEDALRLDYKAWTVGGNSSSFTYGISSVLVNVEEILKKEGALKAFDHFAKERQIGLLVIMSLTKAEGNKKLQRQLALYASDKPSIASFMKHFSSSSEVESLALQPFEGSAAEIVDAALEKFVGEKGKEAGLWCYQQGNSRASRKQVEPIIRRVLEGCDHFPSSSSSSSLLHNINR